MEEIEEGIHRLGELWLKWPAAARQAAFCAHLPRRILRRRVTMLEGCRAAEITPLLDCRLLMNPHNFMPGHGDAILEEYGHVADSRGLLPMAIPAVPRAAGQDHSSLDTWPWQPAAAAVPARAPGRSDCRGRPLPADIDAVVNTHMHIYYVGWNTVDRPDGTREVFFPNAEFWYQQVEWEYWMQPERLAEPGLHLVECVEPLKDTGRVKLVSTETAITADLTYVSTPGHTPGHVAIGIASQGERAVIIGDASHHPV